MVCGLLAFGAPRHLEASASQPTIEGQPLTGQRQPSRRISETVEKQRPPGRGWHWAWPALPAMLLLWGVPQDVHRGGQPGKEDRGKPAGRASRMTPPRSGQAYWPQAAPGVGAASPQQQQGCSCSPVYYRTGQVGWRVTGGQQGYSHARDVVRFEPLRPASIDFAGRTMAFLN